MLAIKPRNEMSREEIVSFTLRQCALLLDPRHGHLTNLAANLEVHDTTLSAWMAQGYVPQHQVVRLQKRFGKKYINMDALCPREFRRS